MIVSIPTQNTEYFSPSALSLSLVHSFVSRSSLYLFSPCSSFLGPTSSSWTSEFFRHSLFLSRFIILIHTHTHTIPTSNASCVYMVLLFLSFSLSLSSLCFVLLFSKKTGVYVCSFFIAPLFSLSSNQKKATKQNLYLFPTPCIFHLSQT